MYDKSIRCLSTWAWYGKMILMQNYKKKKKKYLQTTYCILSIVGQRNSEEHDQLVKELDKESLVVILGYFFLFLPGYGKCPKKMTYANSADPDQTAPEGAVWSGSTLFAIPLSILRNKCIRSII